MTSTAAGWDEAYKRGDTYCSWFQQNARASLDLIVRLGADLDDGIIDVGGGASTFVDALLHHGHTDLTVLDISQEGLRAAQRRLGPRSARVHWLVADLLAWTPDRTWKIWHDRAVLHFFTADTDRQSYLRALDQATAAGSYAILATFAPDGPSQCSGLPVTRYDARELAALLGTKWRPMISSSEQHRTPADLVQPFTWAAFQRRS